MLEKIAKPNMPTTPIQMTALHGISIAHPTSHLIAKTKGAARKN
jgi:hypothetical protein